MPAILIIVFVNFFRDASTQTDREPDFNLDDRFSDLEDDDAWAPIEAGAGEEEPDQPEEEKERDSGDDANKDTPNTHGETSNEGGRTPEKEPAPKQEEATRRPTSIGLCGCVSKGIKQKQYIQNSRHTLNIASLEPLVYWFMDRNV